jgi:hypothetical protein
MVVMNKKKKNVNVGFGGVSNKSVWQNVGLLLSSRETLCDVYDPHFHTAKLVVMSAFENIFDVALVHIIVDETNRSVNPFTFCSRIRKWEDITVDEVYVVLTLLILMGILQKRSCRSCYSKNRLLSPPFFFLRLLSL